MNQLSNNYSYESNRKCDVQHPAFLLPAAELARRIDCALQYHLNYHEARIYPFCICLADDVSSAAEDKPNSLPRKLKEYHHGR